MNAKTALAALLAAPLVLFGFGGIATAQDADATDDGVVYEDETEYDFDDDIVEGDRIAPLGELVQGQRHGRASRLVQLRSDFLSEIVMSWEER